MKPDGLIRKTQSWSEFISRLEVLKPKEKGDAFARLVQLHLRTKPKFQSDLKNVWLLEEVHPLLGRSKATGIFQPAADTQKPRHVP